MRHLALIAGSLFLTLVLAGCPGTAGGGKASAGDAPPAEETVGTPDLPPETLTPGAAAASEREADAIRAAEEAMLAGAPVDETTTEAPAADGSAAPAGESYAAGHTPLGAFADRDAIDPANKFGVMRTTSGDIWFYFYPADAPNHVKNFIYLATKDFYRDVKFHRIVPGFVIQGGEPRADWTEPEVNIKLEANMTRVHMPGALAAARTPDPDSAAGQFYFCITREATQGLDGQYTVYGQAFRGQDVINTIGASEANQATAQVVGCQIYDLSPEIEAEIKTFKQNRSIPE